MATALPSVRGYRMLQPLGEGGMGRVFLAEDELLGRRVAVKMIHPDFAGEGAARARFLREARAMAGVEHPHVVRVYAMGEADGQPYLVMEYVEGETLAALLTRSSPLRLDTALRIAREVAQALANLESAQLEVAKQKNARLPVVTADGAWIKQASAFPTDQYAQLTLNFSVPIFDSGEIKNRVAVAEQRRQQAELAVQEVRQSVREQVHQALVDLLTADANLQLSTEQLAASEAESNQATELYRAQELTSLEAQQAETSLADARRTVANSNVDATGKFQRAQSITAGFERQTQHAF